MCNNLVSEAARPGADSVRRSAWVAAPREDAAGALIWETLRLAADVLNQSGGGPLEDRLRMLAEAIEGAATDGTQRQNPHNPRPQPEL
jgi:hypothetical protein